MKPQTIAIITITLLIIILILVFPFFLNPNTNTTNTNTTTKEVTDNTVIKVIDGDTFELASGDIIRLLCVNAPEKGKQGYEESTTFLEGLVLNKEVLLTADVQDKDAYGRLLRYVYLNTSTSASDEMIFVNEELFVRGYAVMMVIAPSDELCGEFG